MSRLEVPLLHRTLWATGDILLRAELNIVLKDSAASWHREFFRVDSGSEITTMPAHRAKQLGIPLPRKAAQAVAHQPTGLTVRSGYLCFMIPGLGIEEYVVPCFFLGDPDTPSPKNPPASVPRNLLGLAGVIDKLRITFDGTPALPRALYGNLMVQRI
jgi:hypothetical protein